MPSPYPPPVVDMNTVGFSESDGSFQTFSQQITTFQPNTLFLFFAEAHDNPLTSFSSTPALNWHYFKMNSNGTPQVEWAVIPTPGTYTLNLDWGLVDHFKMEWFGVLGWGLDAQGSPFEATQGFVGPTADNTLYCPVITTQPNDLVFAYLEQEPEALNGVLNTYTAIAPWTLLISNQLLFYSQEIAILTADFAAPTNAVQNIMTSSIPDQWQGSTLGIYGGSGAISPPPPPIIISSTLTMNAQVTHP